MEESNKRKDLITADAGTELTGPLDTTGRARNKTVMLTPEMTGHMRSRMIDAGADQIGGPGSPGAEWGAGQKQAFGGRMITHEPRVDDENPDWTRPIEPATFSEAYEEPSNGIRHDSHGEPEREMSWTPQPTPSYHDANSRYGGRHEDTHTNGYDEQDDNAPFVSSNGRLSGAGGSEPRSVSGAFPGERQVVGAPEPSRRPDRAEVDTRSVETLRRAAGDREDIEWKSKTAITGFLVTYDKDPLGNSIELRSGRVIVTSEPTASGNVLFLDHESVSPMHAIMRVGSGAHIQILDQLSESGTRIVRAKDKQEEILSGEKSNLQHGDVVFFGERKFHVCIVMRDVAGE